MCEIPNSESIYFYGITSVDSNILKISISIFLLTEFDLKHEWIS